ncbi:hypothetical protein, variant [Sphaeroforma arctica JP610]|uniref:Condensin complex subunit 2 n=1 Tax=Sphaeroforma arctica JP610 TaxID=667725 RepID=A0A0L0G7W8_9EUKA|nr:hypothetical protein, variant [Sphaeroforma arctica JP610]KNC85070.1 hypothetical protein, variant [Sphaeroforma arctica JP610]|eukprot:XP_014158972.1 hypothetical protein, variant [Sphaeroforma arctica JP610]
MHCYSCLTRLTQYILLTISFNILTFESFVLPSALDLGSSSDDDDDNHDALNLSVHLSTRKPTEKRQRNVFGPDGTPARLGKFSNATTPAKRREQRQQAMEMCDNDVNMATSEVVKLYQKSIQLCTSNKINSTNAWELGLIDHIERAIDPSNTGEINFQRAGSAIDASCKIFSARVDNVHRKVYKVLDDLTRNRNSRKEKDGDDMDGDPTKLKRKARSGVTIEKNLSKITLDVFDTEVDPMFRQTSANFDEGGARGLLLNNLYLKAGGELVFDLSSARVNVPSLLPEHETDGPEPKDLSDLPTPEELSNVDWEDYRNRMIPRVCALENASICQSLSMFSFNESAIKTELDFGTFNMEDLNLNMDEGPGQEDGPELGGNDDFGAYDDMPNMWEPEKTE